MGVKGVARRLFEVIRQLPWSLFWGSTWADLRSFGNSRLIRTSYIWLFLVPAAAKVLDPLTEMPLSLAKLGIIEEPVVLHLPTAWAAFYFMSLAFAVAQTIYYFRCPQLVKQFTSYGEYEAAHKGFGVLRTILVRMITDWRWHEVEALDYRVARTLPIGRVRFSETHAAPDGRLKKKFCKELIDRYVDQLVSASSGELQTVKGETMAAPGTTASDVFAVFLECAEGANHKSLRVCNLLFGLGIGLFLWTAIANLVVVCRLVVGQ